MQTKTPVKWEEKTLGEIFDKAFSNISQNKLDDCNGDFPVYGAGGFIKNINFYHQDKDYLAIIKDGSGVGRVNYYEAFSSVLGTLQYLLPRENLNIRFGYYYLLSIDFKKYHQGAAIPHIYFKDYSSEKLLLPPIEEQQRIVEILDKAFEDIEQLTQNAKQNLQNAKDLFESYLNDIFTENIKVKEYKNLGNVCKIMGGGTPSKSVPKYYEGTIPWATVRDMNNDFIHSTDFKITQEAVKNSSANIIPKGNVIIATRVGLGKICLLPYDTAINQDLKGLIPSKDVHSKYLFWWLKSIKNVIINAGIGATVQGVRLPFINNLQIPIIDIIEQESIIKQLDNLKEEIKQLEQIYQQKIEQAEELRQSILQKAFNGEL